MGSLADVLLSILINDDRIRGGPLGVLGAILIIGLPICHLNFNTKDYPTDNLKLGFKQHESVQHFLVLSSVLLKHLGNKGLGEPIVLGGLKTLVSLLLEKPESENHPSKSFSICSFATFFLFSRMISSNASTSLLLSPLRILFGRSALPSWLLFRPWS